MTHTSYANAFRRFKPWTFQAQLCDYLESNYLEEQVNDWVILRKKWAPFCSKRCEGDVLLFSIGLLFYEMAVCIFQNMMNIQKPHISGSCLSLYAALTGLLDGDWGFNLTTYLHGNTVHHKCIGRSVDR